LNLQAHPDALVDRADGFMAVRGRAALGEERERLWSRWRDYSGAKDDRNLRRHRAAGHAHRSSAAGRRPKLP